jgi:hypothetical protein
MGLNAVRLEGKMMDDDFFAAADELGLLVLPGWCCCDAWQHWGAWGAEQHAVAAASMRTQARRLRAYASVAAFFISSDELPPPREPEPFQPFAPSVIEVPSIMEAPIPDEPIAAAGPVAPEVPATQTAAPLAAPEATPEPEAPIVSDPAPVVTAPQAASPEPPGPADKTAEPRPPGPASAPAVAE